jgi:hypothetical protein
MWTELAAAVIGLGVALIVVLIIHKSIAEHITSRSVRGTILSMEVVAFGLLMGAFSLGEVSKVAQATLHPGSQGGGFRLETEDIAVVFGSLAASLLIYAVSCTLISQSTRNCRSVSRTKGQKGDRADGLEGKPKAR